MPGASPGLIRIEELTSRVRVEQNPAPLNPKGAAPGKLGLINTISDVVVVNRRAIVGEKEGLNRVIACSDATQLVQSNTFDETANRCICRVMASIADIRRVDVYTVNIQAHCVVIGRSARISSLYLNICRDRALRRAWALDRQRGIDGCKRAGRKGGARLGPVD